MVPNVDYIFLVNHKLVFPFAGHNKPVLQSFYESPELFKVQELIVSTFGLGKTERDSSPNNENHVGLYSTSRCSKPL